MTTERELFEIDGWITDDREQFELYRKATGFGYGAQLARDVSSWKPWLFWLTAVLCLAYGTLTPDRTATFVGLALLGTYLFMLRSVVSASRQGRLIEAIARFGGPHALSPLLRAGTFHDPKSGVRGDTLLEAWAVQKFERPGGWVPVLVSYYPKAQTHPVVGVRPVEWQPPAPEATEGARCAKHPENVSTGTCERCGNFVCPYCSAGRFCFDCEGKQEVPTPLRLYLALALAVGVVPFNALVLLFLFSRRAQGAGMFTSGLVLELALILALSWTGRNVLRKRGARREPLVAKAVIWVLGADIAVLMSLFMFIRPLMKWILHLHP
ncbi:MAG: hypothetical protein QM723_23335 [Myxococcaceae bacterium]